MFFRGGINHCKPVIVGVGEIAKISTPLPKNAIHQCMNIAFSISRKCEKIISSNTPTLLPPSTRLVAKVVHACLVATCAVASAVRRQDVFWQLCKFRVILHRVSMVRLPCVRRAAWLQAVVDCLLADMARRLRSLVTCEALLAQPSPFLRCAACLRHVAPYDLVATAESVGERPQPCEKKKPAVIRWLRLIEHSSIELGIFRYAAFQIASGIGTCFIAGMYS